MVKRDIMLVAVLPWGALAMREKIYSVDEIRDIVREVARRYGVERVYLFGSYARGEAKPGSDIDLRIDRGKMRDLFELAGFSQDLQDRFNLKVDVLTTASLSEDFLNRIKKEEILLYEN